MAAPATVEKPHEKYANNLKKKPEPSVYDTKEMLDILWMYGTGE